MIRVNFILAVAALGIAVSVDAQLPPDSSVRVGVHTRTTRDSAARAGTSTRLAPRERGASITVLDADLDGLNSAPSLPINLQARVPGVSVIQGNGLLGSDARLWLRGPGSLYVNEPLVIIDGVRTHSAQPFSDTPSRLEHIDPETIERIEILPGIASAAIHGPAASKGVILVTTKRGAGGPTRWSAFAESGPLLEPTSFPANHGTLGVSLATNAPVANCPLADQAARLCAPMTRQSFNPLEQASHFRVGMSHGIGLQASGGAHTPGEHRRPRADERGTNPDDSARKLSGQRVAGSCR